MDRDIRDIMISVLILVGIGILMVYSSTVIISIDQFGNTGYYLMNHLMKVILGLFVMAVFAKMDYRLLRRANHSLLYLSFILLILVLLEDRGSHGAKRWIDLGLMKFQPSELLKLVIIIFLADYLDRYMDRMHELKYGLLIPVGIVGIFQVLIIMEPDFGAVITLSIITIVFLLLGGTRPLHTGLFIIISMPVIYTLLVSSPYRWKRITCFLNPWEHASDCGFQLIQSFIAFGRGSIFGVGIGQGQQKLYFLPELHTDFIFSIIGEELGLMGSIGVIGVFCWLFYKGLRISMRTRDYFSYFLGTGITLMIGIQAIINIGVTTGLLPTKGLPLPFISWGGSSLLINMASAGILMSIGMRNREHQVWCLDGRWKMGDGRRDMV